jgi:hypothetical protein
MKALMVLTASVSILAASGPVTANPLWSTGNSTATGDQDNVAIAANRSGHVAIAWEDDRDSTNPGDDLHSDIWVRLFKDGTSLYEQKISAGGNTGVTTWKHVQPDIALDDKGNAVVVWSEDPDGNGFYNIAVRVLSPAGAVLYSAQANTDAAGQQSFASVSVDPDGVPAAPATVAYAVAWEDQQGTAAPTVRVAGFKNATRSYEKQVHATGGTNKRPDVAVSASGEALVVWDEDIDANGSFNVGLTRFNAAGTVTLAKTLANAVTGGNQTAASVAATSNGDFAVAWQSDASVAWRGFTASGSPRQGDVTVSATGAAPSIGIDDGGNIVIGWTQSGVDTFVHGYGPDASDNVRLGGQQLSQVTGGKQEGLAVAVSPWGEVSVAYTDDNDGNGFDQIILGLGIVNTAW